jgi:hypothetical protein
MLVETRKASFTQSFSTTHHLSHVPRPFFRLPIFAVSQPFVPSDIHCCLLVLTSLRAALLRSSTASNLGRRLEYPGYVRELALATTTDYCLTLHDLI